MHDPVTAKARLIGLTAASFVGGLLVAAGLHWTAGVDATQLIQRAPAPEDVHPLAELSESFISIAESVTPAVVSIRTERIARDQTNELPDGVPERFRQFFQIPPGQAIEAGGTGFIISDDGYIVTNNHVVADAAVIDVVTMDRREFRAQLVGRDPMTDIAVIQIEGTNLPAVRFGRPEETRVGEWVLAVGNPLGLDFTVTAGIVSAKNRSIEIIRQNMPDESLADMAVESFIQTDAAINPGNSGGPLVDIRGEVVGVNTAIASVTGLSQGYGFAVPIDLARHVADDLIRYGRWRRPVLGVRIEEVGVEDAEAFRLPSVAGALVQAFSSDNSAAQRAGIRQGDVIVSVDEHPISRVNELQRVVASHRPGDEVSVDVIRYGERLTFEMQLVEAQTPVVAAAAPAPAQPEVASGGGLGIGVASLSEDKARELGYSAAGGVFIESLSRSSPVADRAGGDVRGLKIVAADGQSITSPEQFERLVGEKRARSVLTLVLEFPNGQQRILNVRLRN